MLFRRRRREPEAPLPFPEAWRRVLARRVAVWSRLDAAERDRLEQLTAGLIARKRWGAARGFELGEEAMVTVAGNAAVLLLGDGFDVDSFSTVTSIELHATAIRVRGEQPSELVDGLWYDDESELDGQAEEHGPLFLAWDAVLDDLRHPRRGRNVVAHEFAHALDLLDGVSDGTPPLGRAERRRWAEVCSAELAALRAAPDPDEPLIPDDAAENPAEFFAVVTELFVTVPADLRAEHPDLYAVLADFYGQDPAARAGRPAAGQR